MPRVEPNDTDYFAAARDLPWLVVRVALHAPDEMQLGRLEHRGQIPARRKFENVGFGNDVLTRSG